MAGDVLLEVLRAEGVASEADARAVLERQARLGGALDTCTLELAVVDEARLLPALGRATGLPPVDVGRLLHARSEAVRRLPRPVAVRYGVMPFEIVDGTVHLAVGRPLDDEAMAVIESRLRATPRLFVAPEVRLASALALHYLVPLSPRLATLAYGLGVPPVPEARDGMAPETPAPVATPSPLGEVLTAARDRVLAATDRDDIVDAVLGFGRMRFPCVAAFALVGGRVQGHDVRADDPAVDRTRVRRIKVSTAWRSVFRTVLETGGHYLGPVPPTELDRLLVADLGRPQARRILVAPVSVRGRPVLMLYADGGEGALDPEVAAEWLLLASAMPAAFERVLLARKHGAPGAEPEAAAGAGDGSAGADGAAGAGDGSAGADAAAGAGPGDGGEASSGPEPSSSPEPDAAAGGGDGSPGADGAPGAGPGGGGEASSGPEPSPAPVPAPAPAPDAGLQSDVGRLLAGGPGSGAALDRIVARGAGATERLARLFPGPLKVRVHSVAEMPDDPFAHGPVIAAFARLGPVARPALLGLARAEGNPARRLYALWLLGRIPGSESLPLLTERLFDADPMVTVAARDALRAHQGVPGYPEAVATLRAELGRPDAPGRLCDVVRALAHLRDRAAVPGLVALLGHGDREVGREAERALTAITKQSFGGSTRRWEKWLAASGERSRFEWLIEGLKHKDRGVRLSAAEDLERLTGESFGYFSDAPPKERARAVARWEAWWRAQEA